MEKKPIVDDHSPLAWLVRGCDWFWEQRAFVWITVILACVLGGFVTWLFTDPTTVPKLPINWVYQNPLLILIIFLVLLFLFVLSGVVRLLPVGSSELALRRKYLAQLGQRCEPLSFAGGPSGLIEARIKIEDIFIPSRFRPVSRLNTYGLSDAEVAEVNRRFERGVQLQELARLRKEAEYERHFKNRDAIELADIWSRLTRDNPVAVIQGYPGMGKSTLLTRLALYMTRRRLNLSDPAMPNLLPPLLPIFISLKEFADKIESNEREHPTSELSLLDFIEYSTKKTFHIPPALLEKWLNACSCLVLLDGLDEVSSQKTRQTVQKAIREFVDEQRLADKHLPTYNRFLITSRVAGYDQEAFPHYEHYLIAELTKEQIKDFLPRWCRANVRRDLQDGPKELIEREANEVEEKLLRAIDNNHGVAVLAENPFLLTLLAAMQQRGTELPSSRVELYREVTLTLLKRRNEAKGMLPLSEVEAIQRLGPLAYKMHGEENSFARKQDVLAAIAEAIRSPQGGGGSEATVMTEAEDYLRRVAERGGLFVNRTADFYGFFHRTFEEYFAALHILKLIESNRDPEIQSFVTNVRQRDDLWREPYLLAVALKSREDNTIATQLIRALVQPPQNASNPQSLHNLLLAANAIIESETEAIDRPLQQEIATKLIVAYQQAQREKRFNDCEKIEQVMTDWLLSLSKEAYKPPVLRALQDAIESVTQPVLQRAVLILLTMIDQKLRNSSSAIFKQLVPPMLALAGLPAVGEFQPAPALSKSSNLDVVDMAFTALSFMNERGPAGSLLAKVRPHFEGHPEQLRQLALYSLESGTLITPVVAPLPDSNYQRYETAIKRWLPLRDHYKKGGTIVERDINACVEIQKALLDCATEVRYPIALLMIDLLNKSSDISISWQKIWQAHLLEQLDSGDYLSYQQIALFWTMLFPQEQEAEILANSILKHYRGTNIVVRRNAERFIASLNRDSRDSRYSRYLGYSRYLVYLRYLGYLRKIMLSREVVDQARLSISPNNTLRDIDMLEILLGRVLQIQESNELDSVIEQEVQQIIQCANNNCTSIDDEVREAALDILRYLPVRFAKEIKVVLQLAEGATNSDVRQAYAASLRRARLGKDDIDARKELEMARNSYIDEVREAVEYVFNRERERASLWD